MLSPAWACLVCGLKTSSLRGRSIGVRWPCLKPSKLSSPLSDCLPRRRPQDKLFGGLPKSDCLSFRWSCCKGETSPTVSIKFRADGRLGSVRKRYLGDDSSAEIVKVLEEEKLDLDHGLSPLIVVHLSHSSDLRAPERLGGEHAATEGCPEPAAAV